jgi:FkbM family methyltransferase
MRVAVVTPYYQETDDVLSTCLASVREQTYPRCRHILVADGFPRPLVADWDVHHIALPIAHGDNGNLARGLGAMAAAAEGFDAIAFLDADNWFRRDHIQRLVELHESTGAAVCTSSRSIHRPDGSVLFDTDPDEAEQRTFHDTSCLCFFRPAFHLLSLWATMPPNLGPLCDRVMWVAILNRGVSRAHLAEPTVAFRTQYAAHYHLRNEAPPANSKGASQVQAALGVFADMPPTEKAALLSGIGGTDNGLAAAERHAAESATRSIVLSHAGRHLTLEIPDDSGTRYVVDEIFKRQCYRPVEGLPHPKAILDIGANVGLSAAYFRLMFPEAAIYCVEPGPTAYGFLSRNAEAISNCRTYLAGLHHGTHAAQYHLGDNSVLNSVARVSDRSARMLLLDAQEFVSSLPATSFDMIKIDTEGAELPIVLSLRRQLRGTPVIHLEFHSHSDRRLLDELLTPTHVLWRGEVESPHRGQYCYVLRSLALPLVRDQPLS